MQLVADKHLTFSPEISRVAKSLKSTNSKGDIFVRLHDHRSIQQVNQKGETFTRHKVKLLTD